ncbi:MAG: glycosyltransferase family 4 protein [Candidatus Uhrbacteria bacterium]
MPKTRLYTTDYAPSRGGVARYLGNLAAYFSDSMEVAVLDPSTRWWQALRQFFHDRQASTLGVDTTIVVSHVLPIGTAALAFKWMTGTSYVVIVHGMDIGLAKTRWAKRIVAGMVLRGAEVVVANSKALEREVKNEFGVERTVVVYPTISKHVPPPHREEGSGVVVAHVFRLLTVARLVPRKGHLRVLDAMSLLRRDHPDLSVQYDIVGDGPCLETIARRIAELGLDDRVTIARDVADDQLSDHYAAADIFVEPVVADSVDREGFGMVYLEAALHGVPSVATDMRGVDEAVLNGMTGLLVKDGDIAALADAVYRLAMSDEERRRLGEAAYRRAADEFTNEVQLEKLKEYL